MRRSVRNRLHDGTAGGEGDMDSRCAVFGYDGRVSSGRLFLFGCSFRSEIIDDLYLYITTASIPSSFSLFLLP